MGRKVQGGFPLYTIDSHAGSCYQSNNQAMRIIPNHSAQSHFDVDFPHKGLAHHDMATRTRQTRRERRKRTETRCKPHAPGREATSSAGRCAGWTTSYRVLGIRSASCKLGDDGSRPNGPGRRSKPIGPRLGYTCLVSILQVSGNSQPHFSVGKQ